MNGKRSRKKLPCMGASNYLMLPESEEVEGVEIYSPDEDIEIVDTRKALTEKAKEPQEFEKQISGESLKIDQSKVSFAVSLGGLSHEPMEANYFQPSRQVRKVNPGATLDVPIFSVPGGHVFRLAGFNWKHFSNQGKQDLRVFLLIAGTNEFSSGKYESQDTEAPYSDTGNFSETRAVSDAGVPYNSLVSCPANTGFGDNFEPGSSRQFKIIHGEKIVGFRLQNQSTVYEHGLSLHLHGWYWALNDSRTKSGFLKELAEI